MINAFRREGFASFIESLDLVMMDVGARGGLDEDFLGAAWATKAIGFEPDEEESQRLNGAPPFPWREAQYLPTAIGKEVGSGTLQIPRSTAGASLLHHNEAMIPMYGHPELHQIQDRVNVSTTTLDKAMHEHHLASVDYLKLDVEGAELDVLSEGRQALSTASAIKVECSFLEQRIGQPLVWEMAETLRASGFLCAEIRDVHYWRRRPVPAHPDVARYVMPYSRGIAAQCDLLFLRDFQQMRDDQGERLFAVAAILGYFDYAVTLVRSAPHLEDKIIAKCGKDWLAGLSRISRRVGRTQARRVASQQVRNLWPSMKSAFLGGITPPPNIMDY
jgi:FkbM family methyltransferase